MLGGGRCHNRHSLGDLRRESARPETLRRAQIIVLDNLSAHKSERAKELIEERLPTALPASVLLAGVQSD